MRLLWALALATLLTACGGSGGGSSAIPLPEAQASAPEACPSGDATAQLQAMIDTAPGVLNLPPCRFTTSATLVVRKPLNFKCAGTMATFIVSSADIGILLEPDVAIKPTEAAPSNQGFWTRFEGCNVQPAQAGKGQSAMVWRLQPGMFVSNFRVSDMYLGDFGGPGLVLDNTKGAGIFRGTIRENWIAGGIRCLNCGDSINIEQNTITDGYLNRVTKTAGHVGVYGTTVSGSRQFVIRDNGITTSGGCIELDKVARPNITGNQCEHPGYYGIKYTSPLGLINLSNLVLASVSGNTVSPQASGAPYALVLDNASLSVLDSNEFDTGTAGHIAFVGTASRNKLAGLNVFLYPDDYHLTGTFAGATGGLLTTP